LGHNTREGCGGRGAESALVCADHAFQCNMWMVVRPSRVDAAA
jgi:hypothetical protein